MKELIAHDRKREVGVGSTNLLAQPSYSANDSKLTDQARSVASCLTYNDDKAQAAAKHTLLELAHRLDSRNIRIHKKADGLLLVNVLGKARYATWRERAALFLFGIAPSRV